MPDEIAGVILHEIRLIGENGTRNSVGDGFLTNLLGRYKTGRGFAHTEDDGWVSFSPNTLIPVLDVLAVLVENKKRQACPETD